MKRQLEYVDPLTEKSIKFCVALDLDDLACLNESNDESSRQSQSTITSEEESDNLFEFDTVFMQMSEAYRKQVNEFTQRIIAYGATLEDDDMKETLSAIQENNDRILQLVDRTEQLTQLLTKK